MKPHAARTAQLSRIAAIASGLMLAIPAAAQQERMPGMSQMPEMQMPAPKPKKRMDMSPKPRTPPRAHQPAGPAAPAAPSSGSRAMGGMTMPSTRGGPTPMQPPAPVDLQHLDFGNMIGARPRPGGLAESSPGMEMSSMPTMSMSSRGSAPPDARSPDYSDGYRYTNMPGMDMVDHAKVGMLLINQLEYARDNHGGNAAFLDAEGWYGEDFNKLWLKAEGEAGRGKLEDLRTEALWNHAISTYWGTQLGVRQDFGEGPRRTWAAFGVEGLAPLWFETEAALYLAPGGARRRECSSRTRCSSRSGSSCSLRSR